MSSGGVVVLSASTRWQHQRLVWWAAWLRQWGYRGRLPWWSLVMCRAVAPMPHCACGMYRIHWGDTLDA